MSQLMAERGLKANINIIDIKTKMMENIKKSRKLNIKLDRLFESLNKKIYDLDYYKSELKCHESGQCDKQTRRKYLHGNNNSDPKVQLDIIIKDINQDIIEVKEDITNIHNQLITQDVELLDMTKSLTTSLRKMSFFMK